MAHFLWIWLWRIVKFAAAALLLMHLGSFAVRQSVVIALLWTAVLEVGASQRFRRLSVRIQPHWKPLLDLLTADPDKQNVENVTEYRDVTLPLLWFNNRTVRFTSSPASGIRIEITGSYFAEPALVWQPSRRELVFYLDLPSRLGGAPADALLRRIEAAGYSVDDERRLELAMLPYAVVHLARADVYMGLGALRELNRA